MKPNQIGLCSTCGGTGKCKRRGSGGIELCLWLFLLWPIALVYTVWRSSGAACPICGSQAMVPIGSPVAAQIAETSPIAGAKMQAFIVDNKIKAEKQNATDAMIWKCVLWFCAILVTCGMISIFAGETAMQWVLPIMIIIFIFYRAIKSRSAKNSQIDSRISNTSV